MAFTVETGNGTKGATSYTTVAFFKAWCDDRGLDYSTLTDQQIQQYLVAATDYIDTRWGPRLNGKRKYSSLLSRSVFSLTDQPSDGETVVVGGYTYTFRDTADDDREVEIGATYLDSITNLATVLAEDTENTDIYDLLFADPDVASLTIFTVTGNVATTETVSNGSFDNALSTGYSAKRQPLEFPRVCLRDRFGDLVLGIPEKLQLATCEYAQRARSVTLAPDPTVDDRGLRVTGYREKVGPIETETKYAESTSVVITVPYPAADRLLTEYVNTGGVLRA